MQNICESSLHEQFGDDENGRTTGLKPDIKNSRIKL